MKADLTTAALDYAARGWKVFPCKWQGDDAKAPLTRNGYHDASTDPDVIRSWWTRWPEAMIGAPVPDQLMVLDIDPRNGGSIEALGHIPPTATCWSGRADGGRHLYFRRPAGRLTSTRLPKGIDLKVHGYCIVAPSRHPVTGWLYYWESHPVAALPVHLLELLRPLPPRIHVRPAGTAVDGKGLVTWVARQTTNVNDALYWAACEAANDGVLDDIADALVAAAGYAAGAAGTWSPAGEAASRRTIESARSKVRVG